MGGGLKKKQRKLEAIAKGKAPTPKKQEAEDGKPSQAGTHASRTRENSLLTGSAFALRNNSYLSSYYIIKHTLRLC
eukprot:1194977-Prorocentrum_minimum.AAC.3